VLRELVRRAVPATPTQPLESLIPSLRRDAAPGAFWSSALLRRLAKAEAAAMARMAGDAWRPSDEWLPSPRAVRTAALERPTSSPPGDAVTRLPRPAVPSLVPDIARLLGCKPGPSEVAVLVLAYRTSGQPRELATRSGAKSASCTEAARMVAALEVALQPGAVPEAQRDVIVVPIRPADLACASRPAPPAVAARVGERIRAPRKTKQVDPYYPPDLVEAGVQGTVILEALITPTGCVAEARVTRAVHPMLDFSAVLAVSQWQYTPTYLDGRPVPVVMTVTMNYSLP
jgi:TonB family protein